MSLFSDRKSLPRDFEQLNPGAQAGVVGEGWEQIAKAYFAVLYNPNRSLPVLFQVLNEIRSAHSFLQHLLSLLRWYESQIYEWGEGLVKQHIEDLETALDQMEKIETEVLSQKESGDARSFLDFMQEEDNEQFLKFLELLEKIGEIIQVLEEYGPKFASPDDKQRLESVLDNARRKHGKWSSILDGNN